jgi:predicted thioesterase
MLFVPGVFTFLGYFESVCLQCFQKALKKGKQIIQTNLLIGGNKNREFNFD